MQAGEWTWLEVAKIALGVLTPITIFYLSFIVENSIRQREMERQRDEAIRAFTQDVYHRRVRAELLGSGLRRHAKKPTALSLSVVIERKNEYDEAYAEWNEKSQANLLMLRRLLDSDVYTNLEAIVDHLLVGLGFLPLDFCLTAAYDEAVRDRDPV